MKPLTACYYLNNKAFLCGAESKDEGEETRPPGTPCWCLRTHDAVGPDGREVTLDACAPGRPCYRPEVEL
jgi:hypothetical protein